MPTKKSTDSVVPKPKIANLSTSKATVKLVPPVATGKATSKAAVVVPAGKVKPPIDNKTTAKAPAIKLKLTAGLPNDADSLTKKKGGASAETRYHRARRGSARQSEEG